MALLIGKDISARSPQPPSGGSSSSMGVSGGSVVGGGGGGGGGGVQTHGLRLHVGQSVGAAFTVMLKFCV